MHRFAFWLALALGVATPSIAGLPADQDFDGIHDIHDKCILDSRNVGPVVLQQLRGNAGL